MGSHPHHCEAPAPYSPVLHAGVAPDCLLHVGMALRGLARPGTLSGLDWTLGDVVTITSLSTTSSASTTTAAASSSTSSSSTTTTSSSTSSYSTTASSRRWSSAKATKSVLTATLEVVLSAGKGHLHPDPGFWGLLFWERQGGDDGQSHAAVKSVSCWCCLIMCPPVVLLWQRQISNYKTLRQDRSQILAECWTEQARVQPLAWHTQS